MQFTRHKHHLISLTMSHKQPVLQHEHDFGLAAVSAMRNHAVDKKLADKHFHMVHQTISV